MKYLDSLNVPEVIRTYCRKLTQPLISLLNSNPEIEFIVLKNLNLIYQKRPAILEKELKTFFCKFNDSIYVKIEKLELLIKYLRLFALFSFFRLANLDNIHQILHELKEYSNEVDVEFVRKSIRAIGRCAIKLEKAAEKCVNVLWDCLKTKVNYIVQESIIVIRDIFRKYPQQFDALLRDICENLKSLDDPEAKASMIWIIGDYIDRIENADSLLSNFIEKFLHSLHISFLLASKKNLPLFKIKF